FYFWDTHYAQTQSKPDYYKEDNPEKVQKQNALKERIRAQGCQITEYQKPDDLKALVLEQLWALIDQAYPEGSQPTDFERENIEHDAFAHSRELVYIRRQTDFDCLTAHARDNSTQPLVILGESGSGKSALLANWVRNYQEKHDDWVFWHFCGSSPASTDPIAMLRRLMMTLKQPFQIEDDIPTTAEAVIEQLPLWLAKVQQRVIIIFDGLNQLEINQKTAHWLPAFIPANIRLFLSTIQDLSGFQNLTGLKNTVAPLSESDQEQFIKRYLGRFGRQLEDDYINQLVSAPQTANPLYLQVILEELRLFGNFSKLADRLKYYLEAKTIPDLYQKVLARLEEDYQLPESPHLVSNALSLLWATRRGLSESELLSLLKVSQADWSPLCLALRTAIVNRAGLLNFFHDYLRQAVEQRYLTDADKKMAVHRQLAEFFEQLPLDTRKADELPYQLDQAGETGRLQDCISEIPMFLQFGDDKNYELWGYWLRLGTQDQMVDAYQRALVEYEKTAEKEDLSDELNQLAYFFNTVGYYPAAEPLYRRALAITEKVLGAEHPDTATSLNNLAYLLYNKGDYDAAEPLYRRALAIREKVLGAQHPDTAQSLNNLASLLYNKEDYDSAEPL
ncbi:tetratricopeptide repeat protein, partial [Candidatus Marithioploca araucensis]|nr:tetratricopeptide repeat protein [Candidatus Marithioploca araucensis]